MLGKEVLETKYDDITGEFNNMIIVKNKNKVGIYNQGKKLDEIVKNGDRIEIYRALIADPKEVRRKRAVKQKEEGILK